MNNLLLKDDITSTKINGVISDYISLSPSSLLHQWDIFKHRVKTIYSRAGKKKAASTRARKAEVLKALATADALSKSNNALAEQRSKLEAILQEEHNKRILHARLQADTIGETPSHLLSNLLNRRISSNFTPQIQRSNNLPPASSPEDIASEFKNFYQKLYSPKSSSPTPLLAHQASLIFNHHFSSLSNNQSRSH
jgi:hypothetical protein